jgi:hypothetical protein
MSNGKLPLTSIILKLVTSLKPISIALPVAFFTSKSFSYLAVIFAVKLRLSLGEVKLYFPSFKTPFDIWVVVLLFSFAYTVISAPCNGKKMYNSHQLAN